MDAGTDGGTVWLPITEAAPRLGVTVDGLRSRVRRGLVTPRKGNDGRLLVPVATNGAATGHGRSVDVVTDRSDALDELRAENSGLRVTVARLEERLAASGRLGASEARRSTDLVETVTAERARADRLQADHKLAVAALRAELAEARRSWLERVIAAWRR